MLAGPALHHVAVPVTDVERSRRFYGEILGLHEIERPPFDFPGAWYGLGDGQLHLVGWAGGTLRNDESIDTRDVHFALRVPSFRAALDHFRVQGYREDADGLLQIEVRLQPTAGFPQIYILDPDRHLIEINAAQLDL